MQVGPRGIGLASYRRCTASDRRSSAVSRVASFLAKQKRTTDVTASCLVERRHRNRRDLVVGHDALAERLVGLVEAERRKIDGEEIGALRAKNREADALQSLGQAVAAARQILAHLMKIIRRLAEAVGDRDLKIGRGGEGEKLVHLRGDAQQRRRGADKADLPAGQRKDLARGADLDGAIAHARNGDQRNMLAAVEDHVLPDLVADRDRIELLAEPRQQFEVLARIDHRGGIERIVEEDGLGLVVEDASQRLLRQPPMRRFEAHQTRDAAGLADDREIGIVDRLEHDHLVAGLDHGQNGRCQRLGAARRHHHLGHRIEREAVPALVMGRNRLPQFRNAHHRRVLVVAVHHRVRGGAANVLRPGIVRETLAEIDRVVVARELRHRLEDGDGQIRKYLVHGSHGNDQPPDLVGKPAAFQASIPPARCLS